MTFFLTFGIKELFQLPPDTLEQVATLSWSPSAVVTICRYTRGADPSFLDLSHWWLKPSDLLTLWNPEQIVERFAFLLPRFLQSVLLVRLLWKIRVCSVLGRWFLKEFMKTTALTL